MIECFSGKFAQYVAAACGKPLSEERGGPVQRLAASSNTAPSAWVCEVNRGELQVAKGEDAPPNL